MKRTFFTIICLCMASYANAQIGKWLIEPLYDDIHVVEGTNLIVTDSLNTDVFWSNKGKRLYKTSNEIYDFKEGKAVSIIPGTLDIVGFLVDDGSFIRLDNCRVSHFFPYFSCGKLLVRVGEYNRFIREDGSMSDGRYIRALPFFNGYSTCKKYQNEDKQKNPYCLLVNANEDPVQFVINGKIADIDDVEYISSVNDEGLAVVIIKHRAYFFNGKDGSLFPVFPSKGETNVKNQAKLDGPLNQHFFKTSENTYTLNARFGDKSEVLFVFDQMQRLVSFVAKGEETIFAIKSEEQVEYSSPLRAIEGKNGYSLFWGNDEMFPPQFDTISTCFDNKALVKLNGKFGLLEVQKDDMFSLKINKGNDIAFLHQKFETMVRVDMPSYILSDRTYLDIDSKSGIELDKTSREKKNTESGNFVEYKCVMTIPDNLPDEIEEHTYPIQVLYNGLKSPVINHKVNAWFYKKFEVEEDETQRHVEQGSLTFVFNIKNTQLDGTIFKFDVSVQADTLSVQREDKMSETRYKYRVDGLEEGLNNIVVQILEQGCPPASFPFEVEYHKPVAETKTNPAEQEKVVIKKKTQVQRKTDSSPLLEI